MANPLNSLDIPKTSRALFDVGLEVIGCIPIAQVPINLFLALRLKKLLWGPHARGPNLIVESRK